MGSGIMMRAHFIFPAPPPRPLGPKVGAWNHYCHNLADFKGWVLVFYGAWAEETPSVALPRMPRCSHQTESGGSESESAACAECAADQAAQAGKHEAGVRWHLKRRRASQHLSPT